MNHEPSRRLDFGLAVAAVLFAIAAPAAAGVAEDLLASGDVKVRARIEPDKVYVGQKVDLAIDLLTSTWFPRAPRYGDTPDVDDAIVLPPESFGTNFSERIDGQTYAGQTRKLTIFPTRTGAFEVPPVKITVVVADEDARPTPEFVLRTPPLRFEARLPEAARGLGLVVATPRLVARQRWDRDFADLRAGDTLSRTLTWEVVDSVSMLLPATEFTAPDGIGVYPGRPENSDTRDRGTFTGTRVESATYVFERDGAFTLPSIVVHWWDLSSNRLRTETLPGIELEVAANTDLAPRHLGNSEEEDEAAEGLPISESDDPPWRVALVVVALLAVAVAGTRLLIRAADRLRNRLRARADGDAAHFARFRRAARGGDAAPTLSALYTWLDRAQPEGVTTLDDFAARSGDSELACELRGLVDAAYGRGGTWSPRVLVRAVARARGSHRWSRRRQEIPVLRQLNPRS